MIELPTWLFVALVFGAGWAIRRALHVGRAQAWLKALNSIDRVATQYAAAPEGDGPLDPAEAEVAQCIGFVLPRLIEGYARERAEEATRSGSQI